MNNWRSLLGLVPSRRDGNETTRQWLLAAAYGLGLTLTNCQGKTPEAQGVTSSAASSVTASNSAASKSAASNDSALVPTSSATSAGLTTSAGDALTTSAPANRDGAIDATSVQSATPPKTPISALDKAKPTSPATASTVAAPRPTTTLVSGVVSGEGYRTYLQLPSPVVVGQSVEAVVNLSPQAPYKSNEKYPFRFSFGDVSGVTTPGASVAGASVTPEKTTLRFAVTGKSVGPAVVGGTFSFSVCTAEKCLVERAPLVLSFEVVADAVSAGRNP